MEKISKVQPSYPSHLNHDFKAKRRKKDVSSTAVTTGDQRKRKSGAQGTSPTSHPRLGQQPKKRRNSPSHSSPRGQFLEKERRRNKVKLPLPQPLPPSLIMEGGGESLRRTKPPFQSFNRWSPQRKNGKKNLKESAPASALHHRPQQRKEDRKMASHQLHTALENRRKKGRNQVVATSLKLITAGSHREKGRRRLSFTCVWVCRDLEQERDTNFAEGGGMGSRSR